MKERKELARIAGALENIGNTPAVRNTGVGSARKQRLPIMARIILLFGSSEKRTLRARRARRSFPIVAYVGPNGGGKSLCLVADTLDTLKGIRWECRNPGHKHTAEGIYSGYRKVLSTVKFLKAGTAEPHPLYVPFTDLEQLVDAEHCDVVMDEATAVVSSRESLRMDARIANKLVQLRRCDTVLRISTPNWARIDKLVREVIQAVVECRGYFPGQAVAASGEFSSGGLWAPKRVFSFRMFDTAEFEEWTAGKREKAEPVKSEWFFGPGSDAFAAYDTLDGITVPAGMTPEDTCTLCEGKITRHICRGHKPPKGAPAEEVFRDLSSETVTESAQLVTAG